MDKTESLSLEIKELSDQGTFEGILSPYGNVDLVGDIVEKGAYTKTLKERGNVIPMLWQHKSDNPVGSLELFEREDGLYAKGSFFLEMKSAEEAYKWTRASKRARLKPGLSIGFKTMKDEVKEGIRHLKEIKLYEGSLVTFPANEEAQVMSVKAARTKRVDGVDLTSDAFAYVGDAERTDTWKLPIKFPNEEQTKRHIRNALARFSQTQGIPQGERDGVLKKIKAAAKKYGIGQKEMDLLERKDFNDALIEAQTLSGYYQRFCALQDAIQEIRDDRELTRDDKIAAVETILSQFSADFINFFPEYLDARDAALQDSPMGYYSQAIDEIKAGATFSTTNIQKLQAACDQIQAGHDAILALLEGKAVPDTLPTKAADEEVLPEPAMNHSEVKALLDELEAVLAPSR